MNTQHRQFKDELYTQFARIGKAVSNPHRLELVDLLAQGERRVDELAAEAHLSIANASQHLQTLRQARMVEFRRDGTAIYYRLAGDHVERLWQALRVTGEAQLAEIDRLRSAYLADREQFEAIDAPTLWDRVRQNDVTVIDVRPEVEFQAGHIPGSRSIPIDELDRRLEELPESQKIVAYCRGTYCVFADRAVKLLAENGFVAARLEGGLPEWRLSGYPVE